MWICSLKACIHRTQPPVVIQTSKNIRMKPHTSCVQTKWTKWLHYMWCTGPQKAYIVPYPDPQAPPANVGLVTMCHSARLYCTILCWWRHHMYCNQHAQRLCACAYKRMAVLGERWMEGREALLLVLSALHCWHHCVECCICKSKHIRKLDCSFYSLLQVQHTTRVSSELHRVPHWMNTHKPCFRKARDSK